MKTTWTPGGQQSAINITPYIDILLVLLIIFMVIQPTTQHDFETRTPDRTSGPPEPQISPAPAVIVSIDDEGQIRINQGVIRIQELGSRLFLGCEAGASVPPR